MSIHVNLNIKSNVYLAFQAFVSQLYKDKKSSFFTTQIDSEPKLFLIQRACL